MARLGTFFGPHNGQLKIYVSGADVGSGSFGAFADFNANFTGSYSFLFESGNLALGITLADQNPASSSGPCKVTVNGRTDNAAKYQSSGQTLTITTALNDVPLNIYPRQGGTQIDNVSNHNVWIGPEQ
jgi:hypothetical protein